MNNSAIKKFKTNLFFPRTDFIRGMGSVLNISGSYFKFKFSETGFESDAKALASDWGMVGQDMQQVLNNELTHDKAVKPNGRRKGK